jgi:hypothetical protein
VDSSHHVQTNVSVVRGTICCISVHSSQKGKGFFLSSVYIEMAIIKFKVKVDVQNRALGFREKMTIDVLLLSQFKLSSIYVIWY